MNDLKTWFAPRHARSAERLASVRGAPIPVGDLRRMRGGTTASISAAREREAERASIAASLASGPMWRRWKAPWSSSSRGWRCWSRTG
jgi:hypothetical protein